MIIKLLKRIQEVLRMKIEIELLEKEWFIQAPWGKICKNITFSCSGDEIRLLHYGGHQLVRIDTLFVVWGNSLDPPVLVCHGMQDSAASFRPLMKLLPKNFYYVAMELPGNGKSDRFPPGIMISVFDLVYALEFVVSHFRWETFDYLSHSLSTFIGRHYNLCYPGKMRKVIELDPMSHDLGLSVPAQRFSEWYHKNYTAYFKKYKQYNGTKETAPQYSKEQIIKRIKRARGLTTETALATLERFIEPCGNGLWRFTYDQRFKMIQQPPLDAEQLKRLLTSVTTPTLTLAADGSHFLRKDKDTKFIFDENSYPSRNVRVLHIKGSHDVHILHPARVAPYISSFLLHGLKGLEAASKL